MVDYALRPQVVQDVLAVDTFGLGAIEANPHYVRVGLEEACKVVGNDAGVVYCRVQEGSFCQTATACSFGDGHPNEPAGPVRLRSDQDQSCGTSANGSGWASSRAA